MALASMVQHKPENINLRCTRGSSDKVYQVQLVEHLQDPCNDPYGRTGWLVNFQYGRYGKALVSSTKTQEPVPYYRAKSVYDQLIRAKITKGYKDSKAGTVGYTPAPATAAQHAIAAKVQTDFDPQLLNQVTFDEACELYLKYPKDIYLQTKWDGERRGVEVTDKVVASNRTGFEVPIQQVVSEACLTLTAQWDFTFEFDSEDMGGHLRIFDILQTNNTELRLFGFNTRYRYLAPTRMAIRSLGLEHQLKVDMPFKPANLGEFTQFIADARAGNEEGVVIRIGDGPYTPGKPNSGGFCFKLKFVEDATVRVASVHPTKRSIGMELAHFGDRNKYGPAEMIMVGNCAIPVNKTIPKKGDIVDVKYLYAHKGGSLYQPIYKGPRTDLDKSAAVTSQLKYKKDT